MCIIRPIDTSGVIADFRFVDGPCHFQRSMPSLVTKPFKMDDAISALVQLGLDKVETGYNLLMELNVLTKCLFVYIHNGLLAVSFYLMFGANLS